MQVTLSIPIPEATDVAAAAVGGEDKLIDFSQFDEVRWRQEEEDMRQAKIKVRRWPAWKCCL